MIGSNVVGSYQEVECADTNQFAEDDDQSQPRTGNGISISPNPLPLDKAKEADTSRESIDNVASIELASKGAENDTNTVTQVSSSFRDLSSLVVKVFEQAKTIQFLFPVIHR